jgi:hypothetical protein
VQNVKIKQKKFYVKIFFAKVQKWLDEWRQDIQANDIQDNNTQLNSK